MTKPLISVTPAMHTERVILEKMKVASSAYVTRHAILSTYSQDHLFDQVRVQLESHVLAEKLVGDTTEHTIYYTTPRTWWDMFKRTHQAKWWLRRWVERRPVKTVMHKETELVTFERYATYPGATIQTPSDLGRPVIYERFVTR